MNKEDYGIFAVMNVFSTLLIYCATLIGSTAAAQKQFDPHPTPFKEGMPILIDGQGPFLFGLDTGASTAFSITPALATKLGLPVTSHTHLHTTSNEAPGSAPEVDVLRIDDLTVAGHVFHHAIGLAYPTSDNGTLGIELFKKVLLTLDFPNNQLAISDERLPKPDGKTMFPYVQDHKVPVVPIVLGDVHTQGRLDTGARTTKADAMIPLSMASQLRLVAPMQPSGTVRDVVGRSYKYYTATLDGYLTVGSLVVHRPTLVFSDFLPYVNLGGLCNRLRIQLDQSHNRIGLSFPVKTSSTSSEGVSQ